MIFTALVSYFLQDRWRWVLLLISLPSVVGMYYQITIGNESPRFLLFSDDQNKAKDVLNEMCQMNQTELLSEEEFENLK